MNYIYETKNYLHFDNIRSYNKTTKNYVEDLNKISSHSFFPLIYSELSFSRYEADINKQERRNGKQVPVSTKIRPIMYASHIDNFIYKHYGLELNKYYNDYAKNNNFDSCSTAYRNNKDGKSNINFSAEVINYIKQSQEAFIWIGDYKGFFDNLDHAYLKERIIDVLGGEKLPSHHYKIFKSITNYSYIIKKDLNDHLGSDSSLRKKNQYRYFNSIDDFRTFKYLNSNYKISDDNSDGEKMIKTNSKEYGIPQGTAISAIYSNVYMTKIDKYINDLISSIGIYRRYSDDFILIIPKNKVDYEEFLSIKQKIINKIKQSKLELHSKKTKTLEYSNNKFLDLQHQSNPVSLDYLGFVFNGHDVKIREKSIYRYYRTAYKLISKGKIISKNKGHSRLTYKRKLYESYTYFGNVTHKKYNYGNKRIRSTFLTYVHRSQKIFENESPLTNNLMDQQIKNHLTNINKKI